MGKIRIIYLGLALLLSLSRVVQAQNPTVAAIRSAVSSPECPHACFLGMQPGVTSVGELIAFLDANHLTYQKNQLPWDDNYTIAVAWPSDDPRFPFIDGTVLFGVVPAYYTTNTYETVGGITLRTKAISIEEMLLVFPHPPDRITRVFSEVILYEGEQVAFVMNTANQVTAIYDINLSSPEDMDVQLVMYADIRPCTEPADLCRIPRVPAVYGFAKRGELVQDSRLELDKEIPYLSGLEMIALTEPEYVGSVVFTDGISTLVDDTPPYTWPVTAPGSYLLRARPYSEPGGKGTAGTSLTLRFDAVEPEKIERYKYAYRENDQSTDLLLIDPQHPTEPPEVRSLPPDINSDAITATALAPNGEWLVLYTLDTLANEKVIQSWNFLTHELREVYRYPAGINDIYYQAWSPDSAYFAFVVIPRDAPDVFLSHDMVYVYAVAKDTLITTYENITGRKPVYDISWTPDSQQLQVSLFDCVISCPATTLFQLYSLPSGDLSTQIALNRNYGLEIGQTCQARWSPSGRYMAFTADCGVIPRINYDVYLWDTQTNEVERITYLSNTGSEGLRYINFYNYLWLTDNELLLSYLKAQGVMVFDPDNFETQSILYYVSSQARVPLDDVYRSALTLRPHGIDFAYIESRFWLDDSNAIQQEHLSARISSLLEQERYNTFSGSLGCDFRWSPDGRYLAYATLADPDNANLRCDFSVTGYMFYDMFDFTQRELAFPGAARDVPILGWVRVIPTDD